MLFVIFCLDKPGMEEARAKAMPLHREYTAQSTVKVVMSGPLVSDGGQKVIGSFLLVDAESREAVDEFHHNDPLYKADIWATRQVVAFHKRLG